jgi:hypothetical protein
MSSRFPARSVAMAHCVSNKEAHMSVSSFTRFALAAFVVVAFAGFSQLATAKGVQLKGIHFVKHFDKSSP